MSPHDPTYQNEGCSDGIETPVAKRERFDTTPSFKFASVEITAWLIKQVLPLSELVVIFGPSQSGKTFLTLDLLMSIAQGKDWFGHKVERKRVVYIAAESAFGVKKRIFAYTHHHKIDLTKIEFDIITDAPNLLNAADVALLAAKAGPAGCIVIDTLARTMPGGNENDGKDVGNAISQCQRLHKATGALIILVHHTGHTEDRARGWSGLKAAVDTEISVEKIGEEHAATITKQKDGESGQRYGFKLKQVILGQDDDGENITSCIVEPLKEAPQRQAKEGLGKWQRYAMDAIRDLNIGIKTAPVSIEHLITKTSEKSLKPEPPKEDRRREYARRAIEGLCEDKKLILNNDFVREK